MNDASASLDRDEAEQFIETTCRDFGGWILGAWGEGPGFVDGKYQHTRWREYAYPNTEQGHADLLDEAEKRCATDDVYVAPAVFKAPRRAPENVNRSHVLWADLDGGDLAPLTKGLDALIVDSGSDGHCHAYIPVDGPVSDPEPLNKAIQLATGADSKWASNTVLRLPGTVNHKHGTPVVIRDNPGRLYDEAEVRAVLGPLVDDAKAALAASGFKPVSVPDPLDVVTLPEGVAKYLETASTSDRSAHGFGVIRMCVKAGLSLAETMSVVLEHTQYIEKYGDRTGQRVAIDYAKILADSPALPTIEMGSAQKPSGLRAHLLGWRDLDQIPEPEPLIDGVLMRHSVAFLVGRKSSYKSFVAFDWAASIATGSPWFGRESEQGKALYIVGEGAYGIRLRRDAWLDAHGIAEAPASLDIITRMPNLLRDFDAVDDLLNIVSEGGYSLVVFDTLARATAGGEENASKDSGRAIEVIDGVRDAMNGRGAVLVVAHSQKSDTDLRGWSGYEDAADIVWHAKRPEGSKMIARLENRKQKDIEEADPVDLILSKRCRSLVIDGQAQDIHNGDEPERTIKDQIYVILCETYWWEGATQGEIIEALTPPGGRGPHKSTVSKYVNQLGDEGKITKKGSRYVPLH